MERACQVEAQFDELLLEELGEQTESFSVKALANKRKRSPGPHGDELQGGQCNELARQTGLGRPLLSF